MALRANTGGPPRLLRSAEALPAAARLKPALLLSLQAFDAVARLGSFKRAAHVLHITPSAISHRIRNLESALGDGLFTRAHRSVRLTAQGKALAAATGRAFAELVRATAPSAGAIGRRRLRMAVSPFFASHWLIPRVAKFMAAHPDIELVIENSSRPVDFESEPFDAAVRVGDGAWPGLTATHLIEIRTTPVASAEMVKRLKLKKPEDLARAPLIHVTTFPLAWPLWLEQAGAAHVKAKQAISMDTFGAALQAAEQGVGVALGLEPLFVERVRAGALAQPFAFSHPTGGYWLVHRPVDAKNPALRAFAKWVLTELAKDA
jgi:DNA-binding transcriptional LysR family regulator